MIARDHQRPDPGRFRAPDGLRRLRAGRIDHADQPEKHELMLEVFVDNVVRERVFRQQAQRYAERAQGFLREPLVGGANRGAPLRR